MRASADDIKLVAKLGNDESLPFGVMQVCGSLNKLWTEKFLKHKTGKPKKLSPKVTAFCCKCAMH